MGCFTNCDCTCGFHDNTFDEIIRRETKFPLRLADILDSPLGWYTDKSVDDSRLEGWSLQNKSGLYLLWDKDEWCVTHERFHMRARYVGKGGLAQRLRTHWAKKDTSDAFLVFFSFISLENRVAKYVEQLLLDIYQFPLNASENSGKAKLCSHREDDTYDDIPQF